MATLCQAVSDFKSESASWPPSLSQKTWIPRFASSAAANRTEALRAPSPAASARATAAPPDIMGRYSAFESARSHEDDEPIPIHFMSMEGWSGLSVFEQRMGLPSSLGPLSC